ncbi:P-loop NTPase fold protein [Nonomuraea sp. KM90]|uniref:P-loop NTPase fold protein n=1 Tax=Nonomuraea sp. KM90 TaxID=3457428 RepID=UPI003FCEB60F
MAAAGLLRMVLVTILVPVLAAMTAAPAFLDSGSLTIPVGEKGPWRVAVANPGPAVDAQVRLTGPVAKVLAVSGPAVVRLPAGGVTDIVLRRAGPGRAVAGELVLVAESGLARKQVRITEASWLARYWAVPVGGVLLLLVAAGVALVMRRRRLVPEATQGAPAAPGQEEFTHSDEPVEADGLGREEYVRELAMLAGSAAPPLVVGVFGEWGTGKTSLLKQVRKVVETEHPHCAHVWFDPWPHQYDGNPVLPLLHGMVTQLGLTRRETCAVPSKPSPRCSARSCSPPPCGSASPTYARASTPTTRRTSASAPSAPAWTSTSARSSRRPCGPGGRAGSSSSSTTSTGATASRSRPCWRPSSCTSTATTACSSWQWRKSR